MDNNINSKIILITFIIGAFFVILNETLLNIALTKLMTVFNVDAPTVQWLATGFMLVMGVLMPVSALLIQWFTTRQLFISVMTVFLIGTLVAASAINFPMLLIGRMVQAIGTGILIPVIMNALLLLYPPEVRGKIMGTFGLVIMFAPALGPTISGIIVDLFGWRWLFLLVVPFILFSIAFALKYLQNVGEITRPKIDILSITLSTIGIGGLIYGFSGTGEHSKGFLSTTSISLIMISLLSLSLFALRQVKLDQPLLDIRVFKYKNFTRGISLYVIVIMAMFASEIVMPMYLQGPLGYTAKSAGLLLLPGALLNGLMSPIMGALFDKYGPRKLIIPGTLLLIGVMIFFSTITPSIPTWAFITVYTIFMLSISAIMMPAETNGLNELPEQLYPHGTAIANTLQPLAGALGVSIFVSIMTQSTQIHIENQPVPITEQLMNAAMTIGVHHAYWFALFLCCIAFILALFTKKSTVPQSNTDF
ncbi:MULTISPECIES: MDR family MFS transporter [Bacillus cereus group]|uniref:DHA2 family efflux MFS transporter permease subunit n=2 Tax=Bacillus cereus group TaxID=86661 RepID=A0AAW5L7U9_BACCE|nr:MULTISPECIES: MDR family MFS transporter [Bacillus cereus group]MCQ6288404.1 DHA2 family efflux MFS transporter permease subunit [Bacillus cereus]MCQ6306714.1 DHA2 family efflux MFS transporter permease subunit [Bacillus cereus]MCQ6317475.1 DHA2 family efflux MFS transporter permease subunit [Bacillus cereus]MCQ6328425.1 DHA2 family efflux MFS transporter permease subunit [Bacillus cereus]MCQ6385517.1 DHA2 family efflux MFS transporter permease subunit [Bacillus cereus]